MAETPVVDEGGNENVHLFEEAEDERIKSGSTATQGTNRLICSKQDRDSSPIVL